MSKTGIKAYTLPDGNRTVIEPKAGEVFRLHIGAGFYDDWVWYSGIKQWKKATWSSGEEECAVKKYVLNETKEKDPVCDCGCWKTYGKDYHVDNHPSYCTLHDFVVELDI